MPADPRNGHRDANGCAHDDFAAKVEVSRIIADDATDDSSEPVGFYAELTIRCADCGMPMVFRGAPIGMSQAGPRMSPDGTEMRLPILPQSADPHFGLGLAGFSARIRESMPEASN